VQIFSYRNSKALQLPAGFILETQEAPSPQALNRLLSRCNLETHSPKRLAMALEKSDYFLSLLEEMSGKLAGFVRVTSDRGLNANLWDLAAEPGKYQEQFLAILVNRTLRLIRQEMPGCSISVAAPSIAINALQQEGFLLDPGGIRTMGFRV
tara:strand:+ start:380 stop:835 length:456 start_codon:yes stop_codon:yes gene_type:complete